MRVSLRGRNLPESFDEYQLLKLHGALVNTTCSRCKKPFEDCVMPAEAALSWAETQISGTCEECWDKLFAPPPSYIEPEPDPEQDRDPTYR